MLSGWNIWPLNNDSPGEVEWLNGGSMSFKKEIFNKFHFEEKLQKFGGYALAEDVQFSHRLVRNKLKLMVFEKGYVVHHPIEGGRLQNEKAFAARIYNPFIVWKTCIFIYNRFSIFVYLWSLIGELTGYFIIGMFINNKNILKGILIGMQAITKEIFDKNK